MTFTDVIRGEITFNTEELGDFIIARSLQEPLYHFAVVVDDADAQVTHIIRGEDILSSTPRQILIQEALGFARPQYIHLPLILSKDPKKLSKRNDVVSLEDYRKNGFIPEGILNYLALLGWNPGTEEELFSIEELTQRFSLDQLQKSGAIFDDVKLRWFNHEHLKRLSDKEFFDRLTSFMNVGPLPEYIGRAINLLKDRSHTLLEAAKAVESGEFNFLEDSIVYPPELLIQGAKIDAAGAKRNLEKTLELLRQVGGEFTAENIKLAVFRYATEQGRAAVLWPMRAALSGKEKSPDPFTLAEILGRQKAFQRIENALQML